MFGLLALCMFLLASYLTKKLKGRRSGLIALLVGLAASMLLYRSPASITIVNWCNEKLIGPLAGAWGSVTGEGLPTSVVWAILCIGGFIATCVDLRYDHTYNPAAIGALVVTPIAAHGAGTGVVVNFIDWVHTQGAGVAAWIIGGAVA